MGRTRPSCLPRPRLYVEFSLPPKQSWEIVDVRLAKSAGDRVPFFAGRGFCDSSQAKVRASRHHHRPRQSLHCQRTRAVGRSVGHPQRQNRGCRKGRGDPAFSRARGADNRRARSPGAAGLHRLPHPFPFRLACPQPGEPGGRAYRGRNPAAGQRLCRFSFWQAVDTPARASSISKRLAPRTSHASGG